MGIGYCRSARQRLAVTLTPSLVPYDCLAAAMAVGGAAGGDAHVTANRAIACNNNINITGSGIVDANVEAVGSISGTNYYGSKLPGAPARQLPDPNDVFAYYIANGTPISHASTGGSIDRVLISPENNPYTGVKNPLGIYVIDCEGKTLNVKESRIVGTIVLLNPKSDSKLDDKLNWSPAVSNFPALLVQGSMKIELRNSSLAEAGANVNFNPSHTPYNGTSNTGKTDTLPPQINGLIYISGDASCRNDVRLNSSLIVGGGLTWANELSVTYDSRFHTNPPPGFFDTPPMQPAPATWKQVVD
jgi:hypothetical protein